MNYPLFTHFILCGCKKDLCNFILLLPVQYLYSSGELSIFYKFNFSIVLFGQRAQFYKISHKQTFASFNSWSNCSRRTVYFPSKSSLIIGRSINVPEIVNSLNICSTHEQSSNAWHKMEARRRSMSNNRLLKFWCAKMLNDPLANYLSSGQSSEIIKSIDEK